jgi:hypothetical protein
MGCRAMETFPAASACEPGGAERFAADAPIPQPADVPADACLVRLSEIHATGEVVTLDSDFRIYRRHGNRVIPAVMPE